MIFTFSKQSSNKTSFKVRDF